MKALGFIVIIFLFISCNKINIKKNNENYLKEYEAKFYKYKNIPLNVNKKLNDLVINIKDIKDTVLIKSMKITGIVSYRVIIDKNGDVEDAILLRSINPKIDSIVYNSIKQSKFRKVINIIRERIKYAILMSYRFDEGHILSPVINGVPFNSSNYFSEENKIWEFYEVEEKPVLIERIDPIYPKIEIEKDKKGITVVTLFIDQNGFVEYAEIFLSLSPMFDIASVDAAMRCRFQPGKQKGKPVKVKMNLIFKYILRNTKYLY